MLWLTVLAQAQNKLSRDSCHNRRGTYPIGLARNRFLEHDQDGTVRRFQDRVLVNRESFRSKKLVAYKVPKQVEFRDSLPKSAMGKTLRRELAREAREAHAVPAPSRPQAGAETSPRVEGASPAPAILASLADRLVFGKR